MDESQQVSATPRGGAWVTGAGGLIGSYIVRVAAESAFGSNFEVTALTRKELDLTDGEAVRKRFQRDRPALIIHCAAVTKIAACEQDPTAARKINIEATKLLEDLAAQISLVFFSTDLVFDGKNGNYSEDDSVNPLSLYAETKVIAEKAVLQNPRHTVIRTSLNGGVSPTGDRSFSEDLRRAWQMGKTTRLFVDEFRSPIAAIETARAVWELLAKQATGLYHVAGSERLSRWQIGELIAARHAELKPKLEPASIKEYTGPPRAPDTSMNCTKAEALLERKWPGLTEWLDLHHVEPF